MPGNVAVIGAGLSGLVAARALADAGHRVVVLEQADEPGGRLATRQVGGATLDAGAQFFTVREQAFDRLVGRWRKVGVPVRVWCHGFARADSVESGPAQTVAGQDGYPRYVVDGGMQELAWRLGEGLDVRAGHRVTGLETRGGGWRVKVQAAGSATELEADVLVLTPPGERCAELLDAPLPVPRPIEYQATVALLVALDREPAIPPPGGVQFDSGPITWLADNQAKGISERPALTVHAALSWGAPGRATPAHSRWPSSGGASPSPPPSTRSGPSPAASMGPRCSSPATPSVARGWRERRSADSRPPPSPSRALLLRRVPRTLAAPSAASPPSPSPASPAESRQPSLAESRQPCRVPRPASPADSPQPCLAERR